MRVLRKLLTGSAPTRLPDASPSAGPQLTAEQLTDTLGSGSSSSLKPDLKVFVSPEKFFDAVEAQDRKAPFRQKIMAIANKKFAGLPDLDLETYIYETPELTDDASTVQTATVRTVSPTPSDVSSEKDDIDRTRLNQDHARTRFERSRVDANDVNFSDSIGSTGRSYRVSHRRRRKRRRDGLEEIGDLTDSDEEEEGLSAKLARLRREAEEVRTELEKQKNDGNVDKENNAINGQTTELEDGVTELSRLLDGLHSISNKETGHTAADARLSQTLAQPLQKRPSKQEAQASSSPPTESQLLPPAIPSSETLNAISEISNRLTSLEDALGLQSVSTFAPSTPLAVLPTLTSLSSQITTLTSTLSPSFTSTTTNSSSSAGSTHPALEALSQRIRTLTTESNNLVQSRTRAAEAATQLAEARANASVNAAPPPPQKSSDQGTDIEDHASQIRALYRLLPTVESLAPLLPVVLERLRALRDVHAGAVDVKGELETVREAQGQLEREVERWEDVLNGVEGKCTDGEKSMKGNLEVIEGWVRGLEGRVGHLG